MFKIPNPWRPPSALQQASKELEEALLDKLEQQRAAEFHTAMVAMVAKRIDRLRKDIAELSATNEPGELPR